MNNLHHIVKTKFGPVRGILRQTADNFKYFLFQRIPYVEQPVGEWKFKDPRPLKTGWTDVLDCTKEGPVAWSYNLFKRGGPQAVGDDEALNVNVFTPELQPKKPLPVMVYIHGGGYFTGSSTTDLYGPDYLMEQGVVVASFNYRIGVMGFLSFKDGHKFNVSGNAGLKDQHMALKWVKENIERFGGDPDNITLFGESAGGSSVHFQCLSPCSKGLFRRAILMSGSAFCSWAWLDPKVKFAIHLAQQLGYTAASQSDQDIFEFINGKTPKEIVEASMRIHSLKEAGMDYSVWTPFVPTVDNDFIPKDRLELGREAWSNDIDILIGGNADEGLLVTKFAVPENMEALRNDPSLYLPFDQRNPSIDSSEIKRLYYGNSEPSMENAEIFLKLNEDRQFWLGFHRTILQRLQHSKKKTYLYRLDTPPGEADVYKFFRNSLKVDHMRGTAHSDCLPLLFKTRYGDRPKPSEKIYSSHIKFLAAFTQFAKTGDPNTAEMDVEWEPVTKRNPCWSLNMTVDGWRMQTLPQKEKLEAFARVYPAGKLI